MVEVSVQSSHICLCSHILGFSCRLRLSSYFISPVNVCKIAVVVEAPSNFSLMCKIVYLLNEMDEMQSLLHKKADRIKCYQGYSTLCLNSNMSWSSYPHENMVATLSQLSAPQQQSMSISFIYMKTSHNITHSCCRTPQHLLVQCNVISSLILFIESVISLFSTAVVHHSI